MFEIYNEDYLIDSMILGASQNTTTRLGIVEFPMDQYKQIPHIRFPRFSDVENYNALSMAQQVLIEAYKRTDIPYGEVAITYDGETNEQIEKENCAIVYGTYDEVHFLSDPKTQTIINNAKKTSVVSIHNHPNDTATSLHDLMVFSSSPQILLFEIVHPDGKLDIALRHETIPLNKECGQIILSLASEYKKAKETNNYNYQKKNIIDYMSKEEKEEAKEQILKVFKAYGISYYEGVSKENSRNIEVLLEKDFARFLERKNELTVKKTVEEEQDPYAEGMKNALNCEINDLSSKKHKNKSH